MPDSIDTGEYYIRRWFWAVELEEARETFRGIESILETREEIAACERTRRRDAGKPRKEEHGS
jgi:hypothetical protein